jgi:hypothetical protein
MKKHDAANNTLSIIWVLFPCLALAALPLAAACGDDDGDHHHHHECDPECTGDDLCQHGGICAPSCAATTDPAVCETLDPDGHVLFCHPDEGMCEPTGVSCSATETAACAAFQICQLYVEGGTCALPCQQVGGDDFCVRIDAGFLCHSDAAGGLCAPACTDAGGSLDCAQLPGAATTCDATTGKCEPAP